MNDTTRLDSATPLHPTARSSWRRAARRLLLLAAAATLSGAGCLGGDALVEDEPTASVAQALGTIHNWKDNDNTAVLWAGNDRQNQVIFNRHMTHLNAVMFELQGPMSIAQANATVRLLDGCGDELASSTVSYTNDGLTAAGSSKPLEIAFDVDMERGRYYQLEVRTNLGSTNNAKLVLNSDRFMDGRAHTLGSPHLLGFPDKKRDVKFLALGGVDYVNPPPHTTNVMCPERCKIVRENKSDPSWWASGSPQNDFNVVVTESPDGSGGSFWDDYDPNGDQITSGLLDKIEQLFMAADGPAGVAPFDTYLGDDYYKQMNIYVAIGDPTESSKKALRHCANPDAHLEIVTNGGAYGPRIFGSSQGSMWGQVPRPEITDPLWSQWPQSYPGGGGNGRHLVHELFGHGVGGLADEYVAHNSVASVPNNAFSANSVPLTCEGLCDSAQPVSWLRAQMVGDPHEACWDQQDAASCANPGGGAACLWIGGLPAIAYWEGYSCIPISVGSRDIGVQCQPDTGCYPTAPLGTTGKDYMGMAQAGTAIMHSTHGVQHPGFGGAGEAFLGQLMECVFPSTCYQYPATQCVDFEAKWGSGAGGFLNLTESGSACEGSTYRRR